MGKITKVFYDAKNREQWMERRLLISGKGNDNLYRIGASDISAAIGMSKWKSPVRVFREALGMVSTSMESVKMSMGLVCEPINKLCYECYDDNEQVFAAQLKDGIKVNKVQNVNYIAINEEFDLIFASLDFKRPGGSPALVDSEMYVKGEIIKDSYAIDAKNMNFQAFMSYGKKLPFNYIVQGYGQMIATGTKYCEFSLIVENSQYVIIPVVWNDYQASEIKRKVVDFCTRVLQAKPLATLWHQANVANDFESMAIYESLISQLQPDIVGMEDEWLVQEELYGSEVDDSLMGGFKDNLYWQRYKKALRAEKIAGAVKDMVKSHFVRLMGDYKYVKFPDHNGKIVHYKKSNGNFYWSVK